MQYELSWQRINSWASFQAKKMGIDAHLFEGRPEALLKEICSKLGEKGKAVQQSVEKPEEESMELMQQGVA